MRSSADLFKRRMPEFTEVIAKVNLEGSCEAEPRLVEFVLMHIQRLTQTATRPVPESELTTTTDAATLYPRNATMLLGRAPEIDKACTFVVMGEILGALRGPRLHAVAAHNIRDVVVRCVAAHPKQAIEAAQQAITDQEVRHCLVRELAVHTPVGEALLSLLGAEVPETAEINLEELQSRWKKMELASHVAKYAQVALSLPTAGNYFMFVTKLLAHSLHPHVGPFVDELLALWNGGEDDVSAIVLGAARSAAVGGTEYPNLCEGLAALTSFTNTLRVAVFGETRASSEYEEPLTGNRALASLLRQLEQSVPLLLCDGLNSEFGRSRGSFGIIRLKLLDVYMNTYRFTRRTTDEALVRCGFFGTLLGLAEQFPSHDVLLNCVSEICCDARARPYAAVFEHLVSVVGLPKRMQRWAKADAVSLRSVAGQVARAMIAHGAEEASKASDDPTWTAFLEQALRDTAGWYRAVTGDEYNASGSGNFPTVVHHARDTSRERHNIDEAAPSSPKLTSQQGFPSSANSSGGSRASRYEFDDDDPFSAGDGKAAGKGGDDDNEVDGEFDATEAFLFPSERGGLGSGGFSPDDGDENGSANGAAASSSPPTTPLKSTEQAHQEEAKNDNEKPCAAEDMKPAFASSSGASADGGGGEDDVDVVLGLIDDIDAATSPKGTTPERFSVLEQFDGVETVTIHESPAKEDGATGEEETTHPPTASVNGTATSDEATMHTPPREGSGQTDAAKTAAVASSDEDW